MPTALLVDDHEVVRHGLQRVLERHGGFEVVGGAGTVRDALAMARSARPDVVVVGPWLRDGSALDAAERLRAAFPRLGLVVLTDGRDDEHRRRALAHGASVAVPKDAGGEEIAAAALEAAGERVILLDARTSTNGRADGRPRLSRREREVLALLAEGLGAAQIARTLFISESTTKTHISHLYEKLGAGNRAQALMTALRLGLLEQPERI